MQVIKPGQRVHLTFGGEIVMATVKSVIIDEYGSVRYLVEWSEGHLRGEFPDSLVSPTEQSEFLTIQ